MKLEELEQELLRNLTQIVAPSKELECHPLLIGGYAVRAYARMRKRFTEDLDLVICPTSNSSQKHAFKTDAPRIDNLGNLYAFCPIHTYTCYELAGPP